MVVQVDGVVVQIFSFTFSWTFSNFEYFLVTLDTFPLTFLLPPPTLNPPLTFVAAEAAALPLALAEFLAEP